MSNIYVYEERLGVIVYARLLFNTKKELAEFIGYPSLNNNSILKCLGGGKEKFEKYEKNVRKAYRDLRAEASLATQGRVDLNEFLHEYAAATAFYKQPLSRRQQPEAWATLLLHHVYGLPAAEPLTAMQRSLLAAVDAAAVDVALLILLLLDALPN